MGVVVDHDAYIYVSGLTLTYLTYSFLRYMQKCMSRADAQAYSEAHRAFLAVAQWVWIGTQWTFLTTLWLSLPPLLIGFLLEAVIVVPFRTPFNETPVYVAAQCWAVGVVFLKIWARAVLVGALGNQNRFKAPMEQVVRLGIAGVNSYQILRDIIFPVLFLLLDHTLTPYFFSRVLGAVYASGDSSTLLQSLIIRYCYASYILLKLVLAACGYFADHLRKVHDDIRDSRYLVGQELANLHS
jgi:hypothetical protein